MGFWNVLRIGASGLTAQRLRLDVIAHNIANAETTRTPEGGPYKRKDVVFMPEGQTPFLPSFLAVRQNSGRFQGLLKGVRVTQILTDNTPGTRVYDPIHPDADAEGYVEYPNVNPVVEMTNMLSASRSYEANLAVIDTAKQMALRALDIGK
ncbi:flagellar basal body rod protein FlgC [uncultured Thermanaerothrix sp.]|uniref:flagellar basal body rod protein FlgC n=1 Tax=uncultured Thermanaerothrix sp. TaxID=1195149 RepID=UPI002617AA5F|nr:flagellar basal body rod protein FlgC [uncultured Thermanaerothrix sp.]